MRGLSVVIPAYNEALRIRETVQKVYRELSPDFDLEIIVVDDGSTDSTAEAVRKEAQGNAAVRLVSYEVNRGKGYAVRQGMLAARKEIIMFMDADLSTPLEFCSKFSSALESGFSVVIGTRKTGAAKIVRRQNFVREFCGKNFTLLARVLFGLNISDFTCGFKMFRRDAAQTIFGRARINRWSFDVEIIVLAHRLVGRIKEIPVVWTNSSDTKVRLVRDILTSLIELLLIKGRILFS